MARAWESRNRWLQGEEGRGKWPHPDTLKRSLLGKVLGAEKKPEAEH